MEAKEPKVEEIRAEAERNMKCLVRRALFHMTAFISGPMCGRCLPCALGSYEAGERLRKLIDGRGGEADLLALRRIMNQMMEGSLCKKGKDTARFVLEWMSAGIYEEHIEGRCPDKECVSLMEYRVIPDKCVMCGICKETCSYRAIIGEKRTPYLSGFPPFEIKQRMCVKCGDCMDACPYGAIEIIVRNANVDVEKLLRK